MESAGAVHSDAMQPADLRRAAAHPALGTEKSERAHDTTVNHEQYGCLDGNLEEQLRLAEVCAAQFLLVSGV